MTVRSRVLGGTAAVVAIAAAWTAVSWWVAPTVTPSIVEVGRQMWNDLSFYLPHLRATLGEAAWGWVFGNTAAVIVGSLIVAVPAASSVLQRLSVAVYAVPLLAVGPILQIVAPGATAKIVLAALAVYFTTTVTWTLGLRSVDPATLDVVRTSGGGRWTELTKVRMHAGLPYLFAGLQIAAPAALLGAIVGEYLGGTRGLGVAMIQAQSSFAVARTWGLAIVIALIVGVAYAATGLIGRLLVPWAGKETSIAVLQFGADRPGSRWIRAGSVVASGVILIGVWWGLLELFDLSPYFARRPADVVDFLFSPATVVQRQDLLAASLTTAIDTGIGFTVGIIASVGVAIGIVVSPLLDRAVVPVAVALRSIPIIAMTPLIALIFGRGLLAVTVIVAIVTFFPTLVAVTTALRNAPQMACDLVSAYGGSLLRQLRIVRLPYAIPALFASARIALPAALGGALLAEWLATGQGVGSLMLRSSASSRFGIVWTAAAGIVLASIVGYALVGVAESRVAAAFGAPARSTTPTGEPGRL